MTIASASKTEKKTKTRVSTSDLGCNALGESELLSASVPLLIMDLFLSPIIFRLFSLPCFASRSASLRQ